MPEGHFHQLHCCDNICFYFWLPPLLCEVSTFIMGTAVWLVVEFALHGLNMYTIYNALADCHVCLHTHLFARSILALSLWFLHPPLLFMVSTSMTVQQFGQLSLLICKVPTSTTDTVVRADCRICFYTQYIVRSILELYFWPTLLLWTVPGVHNWYCSLAECCLQFMDPMTITGTVLMRIVVFSFKSSTSLGYS